MSKELPNDTNALFDKAIKFAVDKHAGQTRKGTNIPYITHPLETMTILNSMRADTNLLIAGLLHDTLEDTNTTADELANNFNKEVAELVASHTEDKTKSWKERKTNGVKELEQASKRFKMLVMADKVSNLRNIYLDYIQFGDELWNRFNAPKSKQAWYYSKIIDALVDMQVFDDTAKTYWEMVDLYKDIFVTFIYDQVDKIIYPLDTSGENYYLEKGDTTWHPFDGKIASHSLVIPRSEAERLEDNWYLKYGKKERPE